MASNPVSVGRRAAPRLRLSLPGQFIAVGGNLPCIVTNLSQTGALIAVGQPLAPGECGYLRCGPINHFVTVIRRENGLNAMEFDRPLSHDLVLQMRSFEETFAVRERAELLETARAWAQGQNRRPY